jgi:rsbT co-antagonist protein RsbR
VLDGHHDHFYVAIVEVSIEAARVEGLLDVIVAASQGDYEGRVTLRENDDAFLEVEVGVNYMLEELAGQRDRSARQHDELLANERRLAQQQAELVQALSTPILEVWPGVLALPLIGRIDDDRAATITTTLLDRVAASRASRVILDLTGVGALDPGSMSALLRMVRAIELLGARCLWTGLGPDVACQIVALDAGPTPIRTFARLADALALVLTPRGASRR